MPRGKPKPKTSDYLVNRERLLREFNMITEEDLAALFGVDPKTLKNRSPDDLPRFTKTGGQRLYPKDEVDAWLRKRMNAV